ncbi:hypothetical protein MtrunA17_Chr4g0055881 [Medicago truncatula]|uniref:Uncharacterized protein n=1 Tax=Medicago truncatula TaxID=3880 RepID=A0A396IG45_MEDTR|nr:hypothetical protein MtrunA17_Chr4g0055881 [Medicago truncatula]
MREKVVAKVITKWMFKYHFSVIYVNYADMNERLLVSLVSCHQNPSFFSFNDKEKV